MRLVNFRNYRELSVRFSPTVNCFTGPNGAGKTNVLEALHYLSLCKGFSNSIDTQNIFFGDDFFVIEGHFSSEEGEDMIYCGVKRGQKKQFLKNKSEYERLAEHIGRYPLVLIAPQDHELLHGGAEERRKFMDSVIAQFDRDYLEDVILYNRILSQRNALLRTPVPDPGTLEILDQQMAIPGTRIYEKRKEFVSGFIPLLTSAYTSLAGSGETAAVIYNSKLDETDMLTLLREHEERDRRLQYTSAGIHRDDLELLIGDRSVRKYASQGQQKSFLIALRLAQYDHIRLKTGKKPLLLLDDIAAKLDEQRLKGLMERVNDGSFGQIFITDTDADRMRAMFAGSKRGDPALFKVERGEIIIKEHVGA